MAWDDITPGGGYSWTPSTGTQHGFARRISPGTRKAQTVNRTKIGGTYSFPWENKFTGGRSRIDEANWAAAHPPTLGPQEAGRIRNINQAAGITATDPGKEFIMRTGAADEDEIDRKRKYDHSVLSHMRLPSMEILGKVGDLAQGALRGSRLHSDYKDRAVAAGGTKAEGSNAWEADKRMMMTGYGKTGNPMTGEGEPGYKGSEQAFYDKYMNLADMAQDRERKQYYLDQAETAWRNKQTSDRLAAATGFEDYMPEKYTSYDYPGRERMDEVIGNFGPNVTDPSGNVWNPLPGSGRSLAEGRDAIASQMNIPDSEFALGYGGNLYDRERQIKDLENQTFPSGDDTIYDDDFILDPSTLYAQHPDEPSGWFDAPQNKMSKGRGDDIIFRDEIEGEFVGPRGYKAKLGLMNDRPYGADEYLGGMYPDEDEIIPNIADLDYFNQFR